MHPGDPVFESVETFTPAQFKRFVELHEAAGDLRHYELLHGRIVMTPPAGWPHGSVGSVVNAFVGSFVRERNLGLVFDGSQGFRFPSDDVVEPDCAFVSSRRWRRVRPVEGQFLRVVPDLVVEIRSKKTGRYDETTKHEIYGANGVREYWRIDPRSRTVAVFSRRGKRLQEHRVASRGAVPTRILEGLRLPVVELFRALG